MSEGFQDLIIFLSQFVPSSPLPLPFFFLFSKAWKNPEVQITASESPYGQYLGESMDGEPQQKPKSKPRTKATDYYNLSIDISHVKDMERRRVMNEQVFLSPKDLFHSKKK